MLIWCILKDIYIPYATDRTGHVTQDKFEDSNGVIRSRKSKKDRQCNGHKEKR